jgi:serine/threonine-protein kinase RsbW
MRLPAGAEWVRVVRLATAGVASRVGFSYDEVEDIKLAVAEACNNAIIHSTPGAGTARITVYWQILPDGVRISVADEGRLDPPGLPERQPSTPAEDAPAQDSLDDLPESGMGLLLIEGLMDEVEHESGPHSDTTIHMTKRLAADASQTDASPKKSNTAPRPHPDAPVSLRPAGKKSSRPGASHRAR